MDNIRPVTKQSDEFPHQNQYPNSQAADYNQPVTRPAEHGLDKRGMTLEEIRNFKPVIREGEEITIPIPKPMTLDDIRNFRPVTRDNDQSRDTKGSVKEPRYLELPDIYSKAH